MAYHSWIKKWQCMLWFFCHVGCLIFNISAFSMINCPTMVLMVSSTQFFFPIWLKCFHNMLATNSSPWPWQCHQWVLFPRLVSSLLASSKFPKKLALLSPSSMVMSKIHCWIWCMLSCDHWSCTSFNLLHIISEVLYFMMYLKIFSSTSWHKRCNVWLSFLIHATRFVMSNGGGLGVVPSTMSIKSFPKNRTFIWNYHMWKFYPSNNS